MLYTRLENYLGENKTLTKNKKYGKRLFKN